MLFSLSKSFTSTAIGLAVAEGRLSVDEPVLKFFPNDAPAQPSENLKRMTVKHLLSMNTGHTEDTTGHLREAADENWPRAFLELPVDKAPGSHFLYNTGATYMLSAIITKLTGVSLLEYLTPRLFVPLGIKNATWETDPKGINTGGFGLAVTTEDIARLGQLYLQRGVWNGTRILSEAWVAEAQFPHSDNNNGTQTNPDWTQGYGYQFWRCQHNGYRGDGAFGQYCVIMPDQDIVLAITSGVADMQQVLTITWDLLLPALKPAALPANSTAATALSQRLNNLSLPVVHGQPTSMLTSVISGKHYLFETNEPGVSSASLALNANDFMLSLQDKRGTHTIHGSYKSWLIGDTTFALTESHASAVCGAWISPETFNIKVCMYETPFILNLKCSFTASQMSLDVKVNVGFGPTAMPVLVGKQA
jgi:CubicO group peptidase (beta-lactamase class C family)